ncbi:MAG: hypothetical protein HRT35_10580 [Algicola sp.]|nr:hypothetical protein [Algicola sp.]
MDSSNNLWHTRGGYLYLPDCANSQYRRLILAFALGQYAARWLLLLAVLAIGHLVFFDYQWSKDFAVVIQRDWSYFIALLCIALHRFHFEPKLGAVGSIAAKE